MNTQYNFNELLNMTSNTLFYSVTIKDLNLQWHQWYDNIKFQSHISKLHATYSQYRLLSLGRFIQSDRCVV